MSQLSEEGSAQWEVLRASGVRRRITSEEKCAKVLQHNCVHQKTRISALPCVAANKALPRPHMRLTGHGMQACSKQGGKHLHGGCGPPMPLAWPHRIGPDDWNSLRWTGAVQHWQLSLMQTRPVCPPVGAMRAWRASRETPRPSAAQCHAAGRSARQAGEAMQSAGSKARSPSTSHLVGSSASRASCSLQDIPVPCFQTDEQLAQATFDMDQGFW